MPPKKRAPATIQTKLMFKPVSATKTATSQTQQSLFTIESSEPLRKHMSILDNNNNNNKSHDSSSTSNLVAKSATATTSVSSMSSTVAYKENSSATVIRQVDSNDSRTMTTSLHEIGGNNVVSSSSGVSGRTSPDSFSTRELASSIPMSADTATTSAAKTSRPLADRDTYENSGYKDTRQNGTTTTASATDSTGRSLKRPADSDVHVGSKSIPVSLDSGSDDDNKFGARKISQSTGTSSTSAKRARPQNTGASLLEQMATPMGTQPLPRPTAPMTGYETALKKAKDNDGQTVSRPILIPSGSVVSDDGFNSASSLDSRMAGRFGSQTPDMSPPRSRPLSQGRVDGFQSIQSKVQAYSQKRSSDFSSFSKGGAAASGMEGGGGSGSAGGMGGVRSRTLPLTVSGYSGFKPVSTVTPGFSRNSSIAKSQEWEQSRSRSSSPASAAPTTAVRSNTPVYQASGDRTKEGMLLSVEQQHVLEQVVLYHRNLFFTGSAGTGKSVLLRELIHRLRNKYRSAKSGSHWESMSTNDAVAVTASTGIAACNIGGCTLHSFAGVGLGTEALPTLIGKVRKNSNALRRWQDTKVLIVDEVSMIDCDYLDKLEALGRAVRRNEQPWGGIQVVLTGDFFQLPPVNKSGSVKFCFEGYSWTSTITSTIQLKQVFRQKDQTFADMLNEMRLGQMSSATITRFSKLGRNLPADDGLRPTELFPLRNQVDEANNRMLQSLPGQMMTYRARDSGPMRDKMEQNCLAPTTLQLKINAQVMLLKNQGGGGGGLVNGSLGVLVGFVNRPAENDSMVGSDGRNKGGSFNVAGEDLPLVRFTMDNGTTREMVVGREEWRIELPNGDLQGSRVQIPLGLAWSLSIHKSQGQTLPKVKVDLGKVFEKGQAYVAMSRATSLEGLQVLNFDAKRVMVHPKVTEFYSRLNVYKK